MICGTILLGGLVYKSKNITNFIIDCTYQVVQIRDLVATTNSSKLSIYYNTFLILICTIQQIAWQNINQTVDKINTKTYKVRYIVENKPYTMFVKIKRGPRKIWKIYNEDNVEITDDILPYFGPSVDWHGCEYISPALLGHQKLKFVNDDISTEFKNKEIIDINLY